MNTHSINKQGTYPTALIKISDIDIPSHPTDTTSFGKTPTLQDVDKLFGPLQIGEFTVSRQELQALGARLSGEDITATTTYFSDPDQHFFDSLEFDPSKVEQRIKSVDAQDSRLVSTLLYEIVTQRSPNAAALMSELPTGASTEPINKISKLLTATQRLDIRKNPLPEHLPSWVDKAKSRGMTSMGAGLQAYGLYSAYIGTIDALKKGETGEALINIGGGVAEIGSLGLEYALNRTGEKMLRQGAMTFEQFGKTSMGKWLCRGAGLIASVLTLPFDIYTAIKSFSDAAKAEGKQAQDLYVTGGLSVFSAGLSLMLGCAALMGFQAAGPVGIAAAAILIVGARIYSAARVVDDMDDYIELSINERWRAGWFAFTGQDQDAAVMDRFTVAKTYSDYAKALKSKSLGWLDNELKDSVDAVVNGRFEVQLQPTRIYNYQWDETKGESPYKTVNAPVIHETDDVYDARDGLPTGNSNIITVQSDPAKGVLWNLGGGNDRVHGARNKPNHFNYGTGRKRLSGGDKDDSFLFQSASAALASAPDQVSHLHGGDGTDLLWLQGKHIRQDQSPGTPHYTGYDIHLKNGKLSLRPSDATAETVPHSTFDSIERVETLAGAINRVTGSNQADFITANGEDLINAGAGDDQVSIRGTHAIVDGGSGADTYHIDQMSLEVSITEDGQEQSKVYLGVPLEAIQRWCIRDNALVIETLRDDDPQVSQRQLTVEAVYQTINGKRSLRNDKWIFITQDGYHLQPDWPAETANLTEQILNVVVITAGVSKTPPFLLHDRPHTISPSPHSFYYVSRDSHHTILRAGKQVARSTLYVDFDSTEIDEVRAIYTVHAARHGAYTALSHQNVHFTITFVQGGGLLSLHGGVSEQSARKTDMGAGILASPWQMNHHFTLVMRDGVSYYLDFPRNTYREDAKKPGYNMIQSRGSLRERAGKYTFVKPSVEKRTLKNTAQRIEFKSAPHSAIYALEGRSSHYDLYPASNMSIRLSTAAADAKMTGSSTWDIYTQQLEETITRNQLNIKDNLLKIDSIHIYLPDSSDPLLPLESVDVILSSGHRYRINALFEVIGLIAINALACPSPQAIVALIQEHKEQDDLESNEIHIQNIRLPDAAPGKIFYSADTGRWKIDSDPTRPINAEQLIFQEISVPVTAT
ncbi:calcium-binding protein [Pseudomonas sp. LB3P14]